MCEIDLLKKSRHWEKGYNIDKSFVFAISGYFRNFPAVHSVTQLFAELDSVPLLQFLRHHFYGMTAMLSCL